MPRSISWLPRIAEIRRSLASSRRSHLERRELETLFELQPRAAQILMEALPTQLVGRSQLVSREAVLELLDEMLAAAEPSQALRRARSRHAAPRKRALREYIPDRIPPTTWDLLPTSLHLAPGEITLRFADVAELATSLVTLASLLESDLDEFARRFQPSSPASAPGAIAKNEDGLWSELEALERQRGSQG